MSLLRPSVRPTLLGAFAIALSVPAHDARAQRSGDVALPNPRRAFEDSWFWGAKGGIVRFGTTINPVATAPLAGGEWLITRTHGALLVSAEQAFYDKASLVADQYAEAGVRAVSIHDARRYSVAALAAPVSVWRVRPYAGLGLAMQVIRQADPQGEFATMQQYASVADRIEDAQSAVTPFLIGGAQAQFGPFALFVQGSIAGANARSLWNHGGQSQLEGGLRFNVSSAFDR